MDTRQDERARQAFDAVVIVPDATSAQRSRGAAPVRSLAAAVGKPALLLLVAVALLAAVAGGLLRVGVTWPGLPDSAMVGQAAVAHAALMLSGFLGTVIAIERAVAIKLRWAFAAPFASGIGSLFILAGHTNVAAWLGVFAALVFVGINVVLVMRESSAYTALLLVGAVAWLVGNLLFAAGQGGGATFPWWFTFLVLTIAAERLEMTRLMRRHPAAQSTMHATLFALLAGAALSAPAPLLGGVIYGAALAALAAWLGVFDIARRTVLAHGLSRYMAVCLLGGYVWLGVAGVAWACMAIGLPTRDVALHALGLGFIVSMVMGNAPVILPTVTRVKLHFGPWFYVPLALLYASLMFRLGVGFANSELRATGAVLNAVALALFAATVAGSAIAGRARSGASLPSETR